MRKILLIIALVLSSSCAVYAQPGESRGAYIYSDGTWSPASTSATAGATSNAPAPVAVYCYNSSTGLWVPADSSCFGGGTPISFPITVAEGGNATTVTSATTSFYMDGNRVDTYTEDGSYQRPFKTLDALFSNITAWATAGGTGQVVIYSSPYGTGYTTSNAISTPANIEIVINGGGSSWTVSSGVTFNGPSQVYDLDLTGAVNFAYTGTHRSEWHAGSIVAGNVIVSGYSHWYGIQLTNTGGGYIVTVNGTLAGDFITGGMQIKSGGTSALIALNNINLQKASGYNFDMTSGGILALNGGYLTTVAGTYNIYLPTANLITASHAVQNLTFISGSGVFASSSTYYAYDNLSIDPVGALGYSFYRPGLSASHPVQTFYPLAISGMTTPLSAAQGGTGNASLTFPTGTATVPKVVASGSLALATNAIAGPGCQTVTAGSVNSATATGVVTTDGIQFTPNGSIKAVTGYTPVSTGGLNITAYPTPGYVNFDVCNWTASSITPGAVTLNWRVER
jgi:hypothetical protein